MCYTPRVYYYTPRTFDSLYTPHPCWGAGSPCKNTARTRYDPVRDRIPSPPPRLRTIRIQVWANAGLGPQGTVFFLRVGCYAIKTKAFDSEYTFATMTVHGSEIHSAYLFD